ncbi:MAG: hypothetical protein U0800_11495 [Isosphaeraceae bacterium]
MSAPFFIPEAFGDHDAMGGDNLPLPANSISDQFKVVHGWFRSREAVESAIAEHSEFGWELHEVLDHLRIRLRRSAQAAAKDVARVGNPYATTCRRQGVGPTLLLILGLPALVAAAFTLIFAFRSLNPVPPQPKLVQSVGITQKSGKAGGIVIETPAVISVPAPPALPLASDPRP